jgi:ethanolamine ammonia-lyase small subunit
MLFKNKEVTMCFPESLLEFLAKKVLSTKARLCETREALEKCKLTSAQKEVEMQKAFAIVLKDYTREDDWKELKKAIGKKMHQWRAEKEQRKNAALQLKIFDSAELETAELVRAGEMELEDNSPTEPLEAENAAA